MMPIRITVLGTAASTPIFPDIFQNPFQIGLGVQVQSGGPNLAAVATYSVQHTFDYSTVMNPTWGGTTGVTWYENSGITGTSLATSNGNYAFPVAAIRLNVTGAMATTAVVLNILQASNAP